MNFFDFLSNSNTSAAVFTLLLALGVVFLNGFTDAPNAVAAVVATRTLSMNKACALCAAFNLLGLVIMLKINSSVARSIIESVDFGSNARLAVSCVFVSTSLFSIIAWKFSMPSSESHALVSSMAGASLALSKGAELLPFVKIMTYMAVSCLASLALSFWVGRVLKNVSLPYKRLQIASCMSLSFMHGAQDGQKLVALVLFVISSSKKSGNEMITATVLVATVMFLGSLSGGGRIVKSMGSDITDLTPQSAFVSDASASVSLLCFSLLGAPVSTSNIKACSVVGAGLADKKRISVGHLVKMACVAVFTIPVCMLISYTLVKFLL